MEKIQRKRRRKKYKILWGKVIVFICAVLILLGTLIYGLMNIFAWIFPSNSSENEYESASTPKKDVPTIELQQKALDKPIYMLVMGKDHNNPAQIDALYLFSINIEQQIVDIIGIPSNSKIIGRDGKTVEALQDLYVTGQIDVTKAVVEDLFHIEIPYYLLLDEQSFVKLINDVGSLEMYVETEMVHFDEQGNADINLRQGYQTLQGENALQYMRFIDGEENHLNRIQRGERFLKLFFNVQRDKFAFSNMWNIYHFWKNVESNVSPGDAAWLAWKLNDITSKNIRYYILAGTEEKVDDQILWEYDPTEAQRLIGITLTGKSEELIVENASDNLKNEAENKVNGE